MATAPAQWDESTAVPVSGQSQQWDESTAVPLRPAAPAPQAAPGPQPAAVPQTPGQPDTVSAAPPQTWSQRAREGIANSVVGRNLEAVAPGVAESLHLQPTLIPGTPEYEDQTYSAPALNKVLPDWAQKPLIPAEDTSTMVGRAQAATAARFRQAHPIAGAVTQGLSETVAGLTSPVNLALLAAAPVAKPLMALFATQAAQGSYQNAEQAYQAYRQGNNPQAAKFATESGLNAVIAGLAGRAAVKGAFPVDTGRPAVTAPLVEMPREPLALPAPEGSVPAEAARPAPPPGVGPIIEGEGVPIPAQTPRTAPPPPAPAARPPQAPNLAQAEAALRGKSIEEIQRAGQPAAAPVVPPPPSTIQPAPDSPQGASATPQTPVPAPAAPAAPQPQSGGQRPAVQASGEPAELRKSAQEQKPDLEAMAGQVAAAVPGTDVVGPRVKKIDSMENKAGRVDENGVAKTPETIEDPLGVRLVAPKPAAVSAVEQAVREKMPVVSTDKIDSNGLDVTQFGVAGRPGEPMQTMEVQVVKGPAQAAAMKASDADYDRQKEVQAEADKAAPGSWQQKAAQKEADEIGAQIEARMVKAKAQDAKQPENQGRAKLSESSEQTQLGNPAPAKLLTKGTPVTLKDGTQGTIKGGNPNEPNGGRWMVNTPKGSVLANGNDLRQVEAAHVDNEPIGNPIPARVAQVKQLLDQGTDVRIFTARVADDPSGEVRAQIEKWAEQNLGRKVPITNAKDDNLAFLLDDKANVPANANTPFQIPPIPKGKWLGVDLDRTLVKQPTEGGTANEQRISAEQPAGNAANIPKEEKANASEVGKPAEMAVHPEREEGAGGGGREGMAGQQQGTQPAGESAVQAKPGGEENRKEEVAPKYKHGNTQADIPPDSAAGKALARARKAILPEDLAGDGMVNDSHITVRYGIDGGDTAGIRAYLEKQAPFEAALGKTQAFPPSEHSDGAAPIVAPVESTDLRRMEKEIDKHGNFVERSFPEYKPHATLAYVKPGEAKRYTGMTETDGQTFTVNSISITDRDGNKETVQLKGKPAAGKEKPIRPTDFETGMRVRVDKIPPGSYLTAGVTYTVTMQGKGRTIDFRRENGGSGTSVSTIQARGGEFTLIAQPEKKAAPAKPQFSAGARERAGMKPIAPAVVKAEAKAVAPGTDGPSVHEQRVAQLAEIESRIEKNNSRQEEIRKLIATKTATRNAEALMGLSEKKELSAARKELDEIKKEVHSWGGADNLVNTAEKLRREIKQHDDEVEATAHREALPLTEPEEKLVTDPDQNKWKYQGEYFMKALEPVRDAWLEKYETVPGVNGVLDWKAVVKKNEYLKKPEQRPEKFPDEFIRIEVPGDGKFLVLNQPAAIDKILRSAPSAFSKPSSTIPGTTPRSVPRAPKEMDQQALIKHLKGRLDEAETDWARANEKDEAFHKEEIASIKKELAAAQQAAKGGGTALTSLKPKSIAEVAKLPLETNAARARAELLPRRAESRSPELSLNDHAYFILQNTVGIGNGDLWNGITIKGKEARRAISELQKLADSASSFQSKRSLLALRDQIKSESDGGSIAIALYAGEPDEMTTAEENYHVWQIQSGAHDYEPIRDAVLNADGADRALEKLRENGYKEGHSHEDASELSAKAATGQLVEMGVSHADRLSILRVYTNAIAEHLGMDALRTMPSPSAMAQDLIRETRREYGDNDGASGRAIKEKPGGESGGLRNLLDIREGTDNRGGSEVSRTDREAGEERAELTRDKYAKQNGGDRSKIEKEMGRPNGRDIDNSGGRSGPDRGGLQATSTRAELAKLSKPGEVAKEDNEKAVSENRSGASSSDGRGSGVREGGESGSEGSTSLTQRTQKRSGTAAGASDRAGVGKPSDLGTKFYSGFGDPELFKQLFPNVTQRIADWIANEPGAREAQMGAMRQSRGEMDRRVAIAIHKLKDASKDWRTRSRDDSSKFWNAVESGDLNGLAPKDQALAGVFKGAFDSMREELQALKPEVLQNYIENYFPHIWERPSMVSTAIKRLLNGKRPFAGKASFLKQRTIPTMQDGLDLGFKPVSWNPVDSFLLKYSEMAQFLMGHQTLQMMKDAGTAKYVRIGKKAPDGWVQLDDRIGTVYQHAKILDEDKAAAATYDKTYKGGERPIPSVSAEDLEEATHGGTVLTGHYYAPAEAARIFNNFVSRGMAGRSSIYDSINWLNQNLNALQLGISAFHASTTSINAATSDVALGIQQLAAGKPFSAGLSLARGMTMAPSVVNTIVNGSHLLHEYLDPGSYAKMSAEARAVAEAGGRVRQNTVQLKPLDRAINAFRNGAVGEGLTSIPGAVMHSLIAPVMDFYVPRMKLGAFYAMAHDILDSAQTKGWDQEQTREKIQRAWDSIDNRFGQVVYDNLFWHKAVRDSLQLATRSVGWNFGSVREIGGGVYDTARAAGQAASGKMPEVTPRMAFLLALPLVSGMLGGLLNYLWTGQPPQDWRDYFYPRTSDGTRHSIPGYMKDVVSFGFSPISTVTNKMSPLSVATAEAIQNRDFYGVEIRHKDDPTMKQLIQFARWASLQAVPFSFSGAGRLLKNRGAEPNLGSMLREAAKHPGDVALGQFGFNQAPSYIQHSPAMNLARQYSMENRPPGTKTQEQAAHYDAMNAIVQMYRTNDVDDRQIDRYVAQGLVTDKDVDKAVREADEDPLARAVKNLTIEQMLNVWQKATPAERETIEPLLDRHEKDIDKITDGDKRQELYDAFDKVMGKPETVAPAGGGG